MMQGKGAFTSQAKTSSFPGPPPLHPIPQPQISTDLSTTTAVETISGNSGFVVGRTAPTGDDVLAAIRRGVTQSRERLWKRWKTKNVSHFPPARASAAMIHLVAPSIQSIWVYPLQSRKNQ